MSDPKPTIDQGEGLGDLISAEEGRHRLEVYAARSKLTTLEAEVLRLEARVAELDQGPNRLPMELVPERGWLEHLWSSIDREIRTRIFHCIVAREQPRIAGLAVSIDKSHGIGSTPRAAMLAAIERIGK